MKILITGGAGFVGRHFTRKLLELGNEVTVVDNISPNTGGIDPEIGWPLFDPRDFDNFNFVKLDCRNFFSSSNDYFDQVFHLAAIVGGRLTIENNPMAVATDLSIDAEFWNWASLGHVGKVISFSSSAAYPINLQNSDGEVVRLKESIINFDNDIIGKPDLTYGWSKLTNEYLGKMAFEKHGVKSVVYRPFSGYGPDQDLSYPFPSICKRIIDTKNDKEFTVWGSGHQMRDFIHVDDCVDGVLTTLNKINDGDALNLSTGIGTSFIEFAKTGLAIEGMDKTVVGDSTKPVGVLNRVGDTKKQIDLGFIPKIKFAEGIKEGIEYWKRNN